MISPTARRVSYYEKALRAPVGQLPVSLSGSECHRLVSSREYKDEKKKTHPIKVPGLNEIAVDEIGWESSSDGCGRMILVIIHLSSLT